MFNFEKLEVWHKAITFADLVYRVTRSFPTDERFGLTHQLRRAAVSISSNVAEGSARSSADFAKFIGSAAGSPYEVVTQATVAREQGFVGGDDDARVYAGAEEIVRMLSGLRKSLGE